jgi:hypothetical protein
MKRIHPLFSVVIPVILLWLTVPYAAPAETVRTGEAGLLSLKKVVLFNSGEMSRQGRRSICIFLQIR